MASQDGGVPYGSKSWKGYPSDIKIFQQGAQGLLAAFEEGPCPRYLTANSKFYHRPTRGIATPLTEGAQRSCGLAVGHCGAFKMGQRGLKFGLIVGNSSGTIVPLLCIRQYQGL
jgi:hypothetical protein